MGYSNFFVDATCSVVCGVKQGRMSLNVFGVLGDMGIV